MIIRKFFAVAIGCNCLFHQCFARAPEDAVLCGVITANLVRCLDVYGEPFDTSCTNVPCVLGVCPLPWESTPVLQNYNVLRPTARAGEVGEEEVKLDWLHFACYHSTVCDGCLYDENWGIFFCQTDLFAPGFNWNLWWPFDDGPCP